jgi:hypothetical protein
MKAAFKNAFRAGQRAYADADKTVNRIVPVAAIIVASTARYYALTWSKIVLLEVLLVLIPALALIRVRERRNS